jgi:predicted RNA-binding Zn-ribbon protein involved in translation (DUF1610 family)
MTRTRIPGEEGDPREAVCPRCGSQAEWTFSAADHSRVEVVCPDCGRFEVSRAEFLQAESELAEGGAPDEGR